MSLLRSLHLRQTGNQDDVLEISQITDYLFISGWTTAKHVHRSMAMATCILIGKGYSVEEAIQIVKDGRAKAKPDTPHIHKRIVKFAEKWNDAS